MDSVLSGLRLRNGSELEQEARSVRRDKADLFVGLVIDVPVQRGSPEARQTHWIVGVEAQSDESSAQLQASFVADCGRISTTIMPMSIAAVLRRGSLAVPLEDPLAESPAQ